MIPSRADHPVWDPVVRIAHWSLAASIAGAWFTRSGGGAWHERLGYAALGLLLLRLIWGGVGPAYARFASFLRSPAATARYAASVMRGTDVRYLGHNPLGGWMIIALMLATAVAGITGWLYTTDAYWGDARMERVHDAAAVALLLLVALHVAGVVFTSIRLRENLVLAMIIGRKRAPGERDVA